MGDKVKEIAIILCGLLPTSIFEGNAAFQLEVGKKIHISHRGSQVLPPILHIDALVKNPWD